MKKTLRRTLPLAAVAAVVVGGVLLATRPWSGETGVQEAAASPSEYSLCNVFVSDIPEDVAVEPFPRPTFEEGSAEVTGEKIFLLIFLPLPPDQRVITDPETGELVDNTSRVAIDAETGEVVDEQYRTAAEEAKLKGVVATLRVGQPEVTLAAWPRTDTPPQSEKVEVVYEDLAVRSYHRPDPGSGLLFSRIQSGVDSMRLWVRTCDSELWVDGKTGDITNRMGVIARIEDSVTPAEMPMFQRFLGALRSAELRR